MNTNFRDDQRRPFTISAGWLFADLLLALGMLFLVSNTFAVRKPPLPPPVLQVNATSLQPGDGYCANDINTPSCTVSIIETSHSQGNVDWSVMSDMSKTVVFSPAKGTLTPGKSMSVTISGFPCQNGSFIFSGNRQAIPVIISWSCTPLPQRLDFKHRDFLLTVNNVNGLLNDDPRVIGDLQQQVLNQSFLKGSKVGLVIVYGGAPDIARIGQAQNIAEKIYNKVLRPMGDKKNSSFENASYYNELYTLGNDPSIVQVHVFLFQHQ